MAFSFYTLSEAMKEAAEHTSDRAMDAIRSGMNIRPEFWDDFMQLCGNAEGLSELLEMPRHKISAWTPKVIAALERVKQADDGEAAHNKAKTIPTGMPD
jgi:hypothetical protein